MSYFDSKKEITLYFVKPAIPGPNFQRFFSLTLSDTSASLKKMKDKQMKAWMC